MNKVWERGEKVDKVWKKVSIFEMRLFFVDIPKWQNETIFRGRRE